MITTPTDGAVRDVKKVVDTGQWPSSQSGQVIGVAGSSAISDIVGSAEVAHDVAIDFGDGQEPDPTPDPEPAPEPDPMPNPEQKPDLKPVDKDAKTTTAVYQDRYDQDCRRRKKRFRCSGRHGRQRRDGGGRPRHRRCVRHRRRLCRVQAPQPLAQASAT